MAVPLRGQAMANPVPAGPVVFFLCPMAALSNRGLRADKFGRAVTKSCACTRCPPEGEHKKGPMLSHRASTNNAGSDLLSHTVSHAVPSAVSGLTSVFGMGTGVTLIL